MGTIHHDFVIAVAWRRCDAAQQAFEKTKEFAESRRDSMYGNPADLLVGPVEGIANLYETYLMVPDGSKEGWDTSNLCDEVRAFFIEKMKEAGADVAFGSFGERLTRFTDPSGEEIVGTF